MVFSSLVFLYLFLPICLILYFPVKNIKWRNLVLVAASLVFYAWGEPVYVLLLIASALVNFLLGKAIGGSGDRSGKLWLLIAVIFDLGLLAVFKYTDFLLENINTLFGTVIPLPGIVLPIGVSFYTFQTLSYVIDVKRGNAEVQDSFLDFLLFVSLFPQLIAGPILRYDVIAPQLKERKAAPDDIYYGIMRFCIGLGKKVLIANYAGSVASQLLDGDLAAQTMLGGWLGIVMFAIQIYFDFSGYSDMAIGLGRIFGFRYSENFNLPYMADSATDFWRRWHISLGGFFRDYVYIPLGGSRKHQLVNVLIVWFLTGLWHGASWNYVIWGMYFGVLIVLEKYAKTPLQKVPKWIRHIAAVILILISWIFFYFTDFGRMGQAITVLFGGAVSFTDAVTNILLKNNLPLLLVGIVGATALPRTVGTLFQVACSVKGKKIGTGAFTVIVFFFDLALLFLATVSLVGSSYNPFLYFRF